MDLDQFLKKKNKVSAIIQARFDSQRLPGKVLLKIRNKTILEHVFLRLKKSKKIDEIIVATSNHKNDSKIDFINSSLLETYNQIRACSPHEYPAFMIIKNIKYLLFKAKIQNFKSRYTNKRIIVKKNSLLINFKNKHLLITNFKRLKKTF